MSASPLLDAIRAWTVKTGAVPSLDHIHDMADFSQRGGIARLCEALQAVANEELQRRAA